jgi:CHAT domain-containing protein
VADESLGLATGFLIAGASTVWCTLWKAHDVPATLLMAKAYEILFSTGKQRCEALREAQLWLRGATGAELRPLLTALFSRFGTSEELEATRAMRQDDRPYEHLADWAAYESVGA